MPMRNIERHLTVFGEGSRLRRPVSLVVTILLVTGGLFLVIFVVAPQLVKTFMNLQSSIPVFFAGVRDEAERLFASNPQILEYMNQMEVNWQEVFQNMVAFLKSGAGTVSYTHLDVYKRQDSSKEDAIAAGREAVKEKLTGNVVKEIYVPGKIVNIVCK